MIGNGLNSLIPKKDVEEKKDGYEPINSSEGNLNNSAPLSQASFSVQNNGQNLNQAPIHNVPKSFDGQNNFSADIKSENLNNDILEFSAPASILQDNNFKDQDNFITAVDSINNHLSPSDSIKKEVKTENFAGVQNDFNRPQPKYHRRPELNDAIFQIEVDKIRPNPFQPRKNFDEQALKDLSNSIREHGILQPLVVSKVESDTENGTFVEYQLIAGERRLRAAKLAGLERVPVIVRKVDQKSHHLEIAIIENLQRENLDSVETARSYARLQDEFGMTQREIAVRVGKSREVVANTLRLLSLPTHLQTALSKGQINESQARLLLSVENPTAQNQLFDEIISNNLTVREVRNRVKKIHLGYADISAASNLGNNFSAQDMEMRNLEDKLKEVLGAEVKIEKKGESGKIVINFYSSEEIYGLLHKIDPQAGVDGF